MHYDNCRTCGKAILWTQTITGRRMPVDAVAYPDGNIILGLREHQLPLALVQTEQARTELQAKGEHLYLSHFVTCPQASAHRRKR